MLVLLKAKVFKVQSQFLDFPVLFQYFKMQSANSN